MVRTARLHSKCTNRCLLVIGLMLAASTVIGSPADAVREGSEAPSESCEAFDPDWSPDGETILFQSNREGHYEIYQVSLVGGREVQPVVDLPGDAEGQRDASDLDAELQELVDELRAVTGMPGVAVAIAGPAREIHTYVSGLAVVEHGVPVTSDTRFRLASTSKALTAVALSALWDRGALDLDTPVVTYLPELPAHLQQVTPRQLAGHLAGIRHYEEGDEAADLRRFVSAREAVRIFAADPLRSEPGETYHYSTFGYTLLSAAMEAAADASFEEILQREVAAPLGLETLAADDPRRVIPNRTGFYERSPAGSLRRSEYVDPSYKLAGGGLLASAADLARLGQALLDGKILSSRARSALFTSQHTRSGEPTAVGLGWRVGEDPFGREVWHHEGSMTGARSAVLLYPDVGITVVLLSNLTATPFFAFETAAALAASWDPPEETPCLPDVAASYHGTAVLDGGRTEAKLRIKRSTDGLRGELEFGELSVPVERRAVIVDGWCAEEGMILLLGLGPNAGLVPVKIEPSGEAWSGGVSLQGGHSLELTVSPNPLYGRNR